MPKKKAQTEPGELKTYKALVTIHHNGDVYRSGEPIELSADEAEHLFTHNAIEAIVEEK